jgi:hypothetical protein
MSAAPGKSAVQSTLYNHQRRVFAPENRVQRQRTPLK